MACNNAFRENYILELLKCTHPGCNFSVSFPVQLSFHEQLEHGAFNVAYMYELFSKVMVDLVSDQSANLDVSINRRDCLCDWWFNAEKDLNKNNADMSNQDRDCN